MALRRDRAQDCGNSDLLVARSDWDRAVALLVPTKAFGITSRTVGHPRMEVAPREQGYSRGSEYVDLHSTIGRAWRRAPEDVWN